jgi:ferrochelatase
VTDAPPTGVLLAQLGTPDEPTTPALRRYLADFLGDRRVVDLPGWLWKPILHLFVLRTRPARSAALYRNIWTPAGSPLLVNSRAQAEGLAARLGPGYRVELGMRIGKPPIADALDRLTHAGCRRRA